MCRWQADLKTQSTDENTRRHIILELPAIIAQAAQATAPEGHK